MTDKKGKPKSIVKDPEKLNFAEIPEVCVDPLKAQLLLSGANPEAVSRLFGVLSHNETVNSVPDKIVHADMRNLEAARRKMTAAGEADPVCNDKLREKIIHHSPLPGNKPK